MFKILLTTVLLTYAAPKVTKDLKTSEVISVEQKGHTFVTTGEIVGFMSPMGSNDGEQFYTMTTVSGSVIVPVHCNKECRVTLNEKPLFMKAQTSGTVIRALSTKVESE